MNKFLLGVVLASALPMTSFTAAAADATPVVERVSPATRTQVLQAIDAWRAALVGKDRAGLERAYHDDLSYGHTDGAVLDKQAQIARSLLSDRGFAAVDVSDLAVRAYGDVAYVTAGYAFHVQQQGEPTRVVKLVGLDVWTRTRHGWQLIARQLTRPAA